MGHMFSPSNTYKVNFSFQHWGGGGNTSIYWTAFHKKLFTVFVLRPDRQQPVFEPNVFIHVSIINILVIEMVFDKGHLVHIGHV